MKYPAVRQTLLTLMLSILYLSAMSVYGEQREI